MKYLFLLISVLILGWQTTLAQTDTDLNLTKVHKLYSDALQEDRILNVWLPPSYHPDSTQTHSVLYLLDGSAHEDFPHVAGLFQFLHLYQLMPPTILVGIANVDRYRDFTYPSQDTLDRYYLPTSGGSQQFIEFLTDEAFPLIEQTYKVNEQRTIIGQSLGGLLAAEVLLTKPHLFDDYLIVSPSLWWDEQRLINRAQRLLADYEGPSKRVFISLGEEHPVMHEVADSLTAAVQAAGWTHWYEPIAGEDHATILHQAVYRGLRQLNTLPREDLFYTQERETLFDSKQIIHRLTITRNNTASYRFDFAYEETELTPTSTLAQTKKAVAAINGGFFDTKRGGSVTYLEYRDTVAGGQVSDSLTTLTTNPHFDGAIIINDNGQLDIERAQSSQFYATSTEETAVLISGPLLIEEGRSTVLDTSRSFVTKRHPRSCLCITPDAYQFVVADGRWGYAQGMNLPELQQYLLKLGCQQAINLDGGGSSTLWQSGYGVRNYPSDKTGERPVANALLVMPKRD